MSERQATTGRFTKIGARDYVCFTWFERDRATGRESASAGRDGIAAESKVRGRSAVLAV